jgi:hypothetical protein
VALTETEQQTAHNVIAKFFDLKVYDMGEGLRIVSPKPEWWRVEERDLIVRAVQALCMEQERRPYDGPPAKTIQQREREREWSRCPFCGQPTK